MIKKTIFIVICSVLVTQLTAVAQLTTHSKYRKIFQTPKLVKDVENPDRVVGNIIFSNKSLPFGKENTYQVKDTFYHNRDQAIEARAYFPDNTLSMLKKIGNRASYYAFNYHLEVFDTNNRDITNKRIFFASHDARKDWSKWEQSKIYILPDDMLKRPLPNQFKRTETFKKFADTLPRGTYRVLVYVTLFASPGTIDRKVWENFKEVWRTFPLDPKRYVLSVGAFQYVIE